MGQGREELQRGSQAHIGSPDMRDKWYVPGAGHDLSWPPVVKGLPYPLDTAIRRDQTQSCLSPIRHPLRPAKGFIP